MLPLRCQRLQELTKIFLSRFQISFWISECPYFKIVEIVQNCCPKSLCCCCCCCLFHSVQSFSLSPLERRGRKGGKGERGEREKGGKGGRGGSSRDLLSNATFERKPHGDILSLVDFLPFQKRKQSMYLTRSYIRTGVWVVSQESKLVSQQTCHPGQSDGRFIG